MTALPLRRRGKHAHARTATATPEPQAHRAPGRFTRFPLPPGLSATDTHLYVEQAAPGEAHEDPAMTQAPDARTLPVFPSAAGEEAAMAGAEAALRPATTEAGLPLRQHLASIPVRPRKPADKELMQKVIDGLRNLDAGSGASLRCITAGDSPSLHITLRGSPSFAGITRLPDGTPMAGLWLDCEDEDGRLVIDALSVAWLGRLIDAAEEARERLHAVLNAAPDEAADGSEAA